MIIPLPSPVPVTETITQTTQRDNVQIEFAYADFVAGKVTVKIQPWNHEIVIDGENYEAMRAQFEAGLAAAFAPAITAYLTSLMPAPSEVAE